MRILSGSRGFCSIIVSIKEPGVYKKRCDVTATTTPLFPSVMTRVASLLILSISSACYGASLLLSKASNWPMPLQSCRGVAVSGLLQVERRCLDCLGTPIPHPAKYWPECRCTVYISYPIYGKARDESHREEESGNAGEVGD